MTQTNASNNSRQAGHNNSEPLQNQTLPPPAELATILARRARELAKEPPVESAGQTIKLLVFRLGDERYGVDVTNVREIHPLEQLTSVPRTPNFSAGVFSARGRILSVIDLRAFLGLPVSADQPGRGAEKIIAVTNTDPISEAANLEVGILADEVTDVITIFKDNIEPPLTTHSGIQTEFLHGITSDLLVVLNLNALLSDKRLIVFEEIV